MGSKREREKTHNNGKDKKAKKAKKEKHSKKKSKRQYSSSPSDGVLVLFSIVLPCYAAWTAHIVLHSSCTCTWHGLTSVAVYISLRPKL